jgi:hypothetical protein
MGKTGMCDVPPGLLRSAPIRPNYWYCPIVTDFTLVHAIVGAQWSGAQ